MKAIVLGDLCGYNGKTFRKQSSKTPSSAEWSKGQNAGTEAVVASAALHPLWRCVRCVESKPRLTDAVVKLLYVPAVCFALVACSIQEWIIHRRIINRTVIHTAKPCRFFFRP